MSPSTIYRGLGPGAGIVLALLGWLALAPAAGASCGSRAIAAAWGSRDPAAGLEVVALGVESSPFAPDSAPTCDGPSCSRRAPTPLPGRGAETLAAHGDGLADAPASTSPPASSRRAWGVDATLGDLRAPSGVFHPPRLLS
jgi:hypothetical protein